VKVIIYCQHVLGVGHFFRTLEIAKAMKNFDVVLVTGGGKLDADLPDHIRHVTLPGLMMDNNFNSLYSVDPQKKLEDVKLLRQKQLFELIQTENPDVFLVELYPFGRRAFRFELIPVLNFIKDNIASTCKVICSLRDILVEKENTLKYETRVIDALNLWFDAVLVHSDSQLIKLDKTFSRLNQIKIPIVYTGFVTPVPDPKVAKRIRQDMDLASNERLIVASVGGGNVGASLLKAVVHAYNELPSKKNIRLNIYTGPYMNAKDRDWLHALAVEGIIVEEFARDFVSLLGVSDLSISMAGYNTCMNIVAANVPALVWPFSQNREQRERALKIGRFAPMAILKDQDLAPLRLSQLIEENLDRTVLEKNHQLNIHGAIQTMHWIKEYINN